MREHEREASLAQQAAYAEARQAEEAVRLAEAQRVVAKKRLAEAAARRRKISAEMEALRARSVRPGEGRGATVTLEMTGGVGARPDQALADRLDQVLRRLEAVEKRLAAIEARVAPDNFDPFRRPGDDRKGVKDDGKGVKRP